MHPLQPEVLSADPALAARAYWLPGSHVTLQSASGDPTVLPPSSPSALAAFPPDASPPPLPPRAPVLDATHMLQIFRGHALTGMGVYVASLGFVLVTFVWLVGRPCAKYIKLNFACTRVVISLVFLIIGLVPRLLAFTILGVTVLALIAPILTSYSLTPGTVQHEQAHCCSPAPSAHTLVFRATGMFAAMVDLTAYLPCLSIIILLVHDVALLGMGVPPPKWRPVEAASLVLVAGALQAIATGSIADVLYVLSWPTVFLSGYFDAWWSVVIIPFSVGALVLFCIATCCFRALRALAMFIASPSNGSSGVPPLVDFVTNRVYRAWLGRAIFAFPIVMVTSFSFGLSYLLQPVNEANTATYRLLPICPAPLSERLSGLGASGLFWLAILLTGNEPGHGRFIARAMTGMSIPETASLQELFELSGSAKPTFSSESLMHAAWTLAFEPYPEACLDDGSIPVGVARAPPGVPGFAENIALPTFHMQMVHVNAGLCYGCTSSATAAVAEAPANCSATLLGPTTLSAPSGTGLFEFVGLRLVGTSDNLDLCPGRYRLSFTLHASDHRIFATVQLVDRGSGDPVITTGSNQQWPTFNALTGGMRVLSSTLTTITATADSITTMVTTNVTTAALGAFDIPAELSDPLTNAAGQAQTAIADMQAAAGDAAAQVGNTTLLPVGAISSTTTTIETRKPHQALVMLTPPPADVRAEEPFTTTVLLQTAQGLPIRGELVQALMFAPAGSGVRLTPGCSVAITDERGRATFRLSLTPGDSTHAFLMFGSAGTFQNDGPTSWLSAIANAVQGLAQSGPANALVMTMPTIASTMTAAAGALSGEVAEKRRHVKGKEVASEAPVTSLVGCSASDPKCADAFKRTLDRMHRSTAQREAATQTDSSQAYSGQSMQSPRKVPSRLERIPLYGHPFITLSEGGTQADGTPSAPTLGILPSRGGFRPLATASVAAASTALDRALREAGGLMSNFSQLPQMLTNLTSEGGFETLLQSSFDQIGGVDGLLSSFSQILGGHAEQLLNSQTLEKLQACTNLFSVVEAASAGASDAAFEAYVSILRAVQRALASAEDVVDGPAMDPTTARALAVRRAVRDALETATGDAAELLAPLAAMWDLEMLESGQNISAALRKNISSELLTYALQHSKKGGALAANATTPVLDVLQPLATEVGSGSAFDADAPYPIGNDSLSDLSHLPPVNVPALPDEANLTAIRTMLDELFNGALATGGQQASQAQTLLNQGKAEGIAAVSKLPSAFQALAQMMAEPATGGVAILDAFVSDLIEQPEGVLKSLLNAAGLAAPQAAAGAITDAVGDAFDNRSAYLGAMNDIVRQAGLPIGGQLPAGSTLNISSLVGQFEGLGVNTSGVEKCYDAASATLSQARLLIDALPTWPEMLVEAQRVGAALLAIALEQLGLPDGFVDMIGGQLATFWPDFQILWDSHLAQITQDLGHIGEALDELFPSVPTSLPALIAAVMDGTIPLPPGMPDVQLPSLNGTAISLPAASVPGLLASTNFTLLKLAINMPEIPTPDLISGLINGTIPLPTKLADLPEIEMPGIGSISVSTLPDVLKAQVHGLIPPQLLAMSSQLPFDLPSWLPAGASAATMAKRRLRRSVRGRALLAMVESTQDGTGHARATKHWHSALKRQARYAKRAASGKPHLSRVGTTLLEQAAQAATTSSSTGIPAGPSLVSASTDWTWLAQMGLTALLGLAGISAPPTSVLAFNGSLDVAVVASVELTAPIVGYGIARSETGSLTARKVPVETLQTVIANHSNGEGLITEHVFAVEQDAGEAPALTSCEAFGYLHYTTESQQPENIMLFQPSGLIQFNWLLNAGVRPDGAPRTFCPQIDEPPDDRTVLAGTTGVEERPYGRFGVSPIIFDPSGDLAAAKSSPARGGSYRARLARARIERSCPADPLSLMRTEVAPLCRESYLATGQVAPFTDSSIDNGEHGTRGPQLIVKDHNGNGVKGKSCEIEIVSSAGFLWSMLDFTPMRLSYECGPSDADGRITIRDFKIVGGSTHQVEFRVTVDGVESHPTPGGAWRFDSQLFYLSTDHSKGDHLGVVFYGGSGSIYLFVLLSLFVMSHNALSLQYGRPGMRAPFTLRLLGNIALLALCYTTAAFFSRHFIHSNDTDPTVGRISLLSMRDMVATRAASLSIGSWLLALLTLSLAAYVTIAVAVIWLQDQLSAFYRAARRASRRLGLARRFKSVLPYLTRLYECGSSCTISVNRGVCLPFEKLFDCCGACLVKLPGGKRFRKGVVGFQRAFSKVKDEYDGQLEPPPYIKILGVTFTSPLEPRGEQRQRCARNYVRKHFRGRAYLRAKLEDHIERINWRSSNILTLGISRLLGLDTRVTAHLPFEGPESFFFPERFYYAAVLSLWFQMLISLALVAGTRALEGQLHAVGDRIAQLDAMANAHLQPQALAALGATEIMPLGAIAITFCANAYQMLGFGDGVGALVGVLQSDMFSFMVMAAQIAGFLAGAIHAVMLSAYFRRYRRRIFDMRIGRYFFVRGQYDETAGSSFIGYHVAFMVFSTGVLLTVFFTIIVAIAGLTVGVVLYAQGYWDPPVPEANVNQTLATISLQAATGASLAPLPPFPPPPPIPGAHTDAYTTYAETLVTRLSIIGVPTIVWWAVVAFAFQYIFNKCVWFVPATRLRNGDIANRWLRFRFWYAIYEYILILPNVAIGLLFIFLRSVVAYFLWIYYTFSIDICLVPSGTGIEASDAGFSTYVAVARNDHRYNNPIVMVFLAVLQDELHRKRLASARIKLRTQLRKNIAAREAAQRHEYSEGQVIDKMKMLTNVRRSSHPGLLQQMLLRPRESIDPPREASLEAGETSLRPNFDSSGEVRPSEELIAEAHRRRKVIRRWQLLLVLNGNPTLINMRASRLGTHGLDDHDGNDLAVLVSNAGSMLKSTGKLLSKGGELGGAAVRSVSRRATKVAKGVQKRLKKSTMKKSEAPGEEDQEEDEKDEDDEAEKVMEAEDADDPDDPNSPEAVATKERNQGIAKGFY